MEKFEIVIVGAGPGGLRAAKILAEAGGKIIVLEKKPGMGRKICAGGAFPKIFQLGIPEDLVERKFNRIIFHLPNRKRELKSKDFLLATIDREKLGNFMAKEAEKVGAKILLNSEVKVIEKNRVILKDSRAIYFDYLIGADGGTSIVRRYLGLPIRFALCFQYTLPEYFEDLEIFYDPKLFGPGYAWIFPHQNSTKVGCGTDFKSQTARQLKENFHHWLKKMKINFEGAKLEGAMINYDYRGYQFGNIFLIGEAGGFVSGLSGAGIYQALISGQEIAKKILNPKYKPKINSILIPLKIEEKILKILNLSQSFTRLFQEFYIFSLYFKTKFFELLKK